MTGAAIELLKHKRNRKLTINCKFVFYFTREHQKLMPYSWSLASRQNTAFGVQSVETVEGRSFNVVIGLLQGALLHRKK